MCDHLPTRKMESTKGGASFLSMTNSSGFSAKVGELDVPIRSMETMEAWILWRFENSPTSWTFRLFA